MREDSGRENWDCATILFQKKRNRKENPGNSRLKTIFWMLKEAWFDILLLRIWRSENNLPPLLPPVIMFIKHSKLSTIFGIVFELLTITIICSNCQQQQQPQQQSQFSSLDSNSGTVSPNVPNVQEKFKITKNSIIRTHDSRALGAKYLNETELSSNQDCLQWCWNTNSCNLAVFEEKVNHNSKRILKRFLNWFLYLKVKGSCYLFDCGTSGDFRCRFTPHSFYSSSLLQVNRNSYLLNEWKNQSNQEKELTNLAGKSVPLVNSLPATTAPKGRFEQCFVFFDLQCKVERRKQAGIFLIVLYCFVCVWQYQNVVTINLNVPQPVNVSQSTTFVMAFLNVPTEVMKPTSWNVINHDWAHLSMVGAWEHHNRMWKASEMKSETVL